MKRLALLAFCIVLAVLVGPAISQTVIVGQGCPIRGMPTTWAWIFTGNGCGTAIPQLAGFMLQESTGFVLQEDGGKMCLQGNLSC